MIPLSSILCLFLIPFAVAEFTDGYRNSNPIELVKDVAIIGGGASGTYAAVRLREDLNMSIVLIEPKPRLGGHTDSYRVPNTNYTINYGVQSYLPYGPALDFFARFGITIQTFASKRLTALNVDVETGKVLKGYIAPSANVTNEAFKRWLNITSEYKDMLEPGYWNFPQPEDIPEDFLMPFEDFAKKYQIEAAIPRITAISGVGYGGIRHLLTLNIFQAFGWSLTKDLLQGTLFQPVDNNGILYERARPTQIRCAIIKHCQRCEKDVKRSRAIGETRRRRIPYQSTPGTVYRGPESKKPRSLSPRQQRNGSSLNLVPRRRAGRHHKGTLYTRKLLHHVPTFISRTIEPAFTQRLAIQLTFGLHRPVWPRTIQGGFRR
ncbi:hypothetical protein P3342_010992 [Pyrenophora teres f. teres]|nr:hypothetical protein P3342_010992 [Pyrenophora teres f. teres]